MQFMLHWKKWKLLQILFLRYKQIKLFVLSKKEQILSVLFFYAIIIVEEKIEGADL